MEGWSEFADYTSHMDFSVYAEIPGWAQSHALGVVDAPELDEVGMAAALRLAVSRALDGLAK